MRIVAGKDDLPAGPEGPYEADAPVARARVQVHDLRYTEDALRMLDFIDNLRSESGRILQALLSNSP